MKKVTKERLLRMEAISKKLSPSLNKMAKGKKLIKTEVDVLKKLTSELLFLSVALEY